jgi:hypothetical protein
MNVWCNESFDCHVEAALTEVGGRSGGRGRIVERRPHALHLVSHLDAGGTRIQHKQKSSPRALINPEKRFAEVGCAPL